MKRAFLLLSLLLFLPASALADAESVYTLNCGGETIARVVYEPSVGDEYLSGNNTLYRVTGVDSAALSAAAESLGEIKLPDVSFLRATDTIAVFNEDKLIAIYCTHSDESYEPTDGTSSIEGHGGIYDVAHSFADALESEGVSVIISDETHLPHDSAAYRRSRQTAAELVKQSPDVLIDIHRDGIPDPSEYEKTVDGQEVSMVRLLVGRSNPNADSNRDFAYGIKAAADELYPGLIKDIYIGKGTYNQDLMPRAILLEFGTHTIEKEKVLESTSMMANAVKTAVYGDTTGGVDNTSKQEEEGGGGAVTGILIVIGIAVVLLIVFSVLNARSGGGTLARMKKTMNEMTGGIFKKDKSDGK